MLLLFCSIHTRLDVCRQHQANLCSFCVSSWWCTVKSLHSYHSGSHFNISFLFYKTNIAYGIIMCVSIIVSLPPNKFLNSWFIIVCSLLRNHCRWLLYLITLSDIYRDPT
jgi:hypothetical protein